jgi:hypothetical protein
MLVNAKNEGPVYKLFDSLYLYQELVNAPETSLLSVCVWR